jgi:DNA replicative helicase MCM subunit Mcm2 (Cdc46/Mcm family)
MQGTRLLGFDETTFVFADEGPTDEQLHLEPSPGAARRNPEQVRAYISRLGGSDVPTQAIAREFMEAGLDPRTARRHLERAVEEGQIVRPSYGHYSLLSSTSTLPPSNATDDGWRDN